VTRGSNLLARATATLMGFPTSGVNQPITVTLSVRASDERWARTVADKTFLSTLSFAKSRSEGLIRERSGPIAIDMALMLQGSRMSYLIRRWSLFGVPMPLWLGPKTIAVETVDAAGRFCFDIELWHPFTGLLVHYAGWLQPSHDAA